MVCRKVTGRKGHTALLDGSCQLFLRSDWSVLRIALFLKETRRHFYWFPFHGGLPAAGDCVATAIKAAYLDLPLDLTLPDAYLQRYRDPLPVLKFTVLEPWYVH